MMLVVVAILINNYIHKFMQTIVLKFIPKNPGSQAEKELKKGLK